MPKGVEHIMGLNDGDGDRGVESLMPKGVEHDLLKMLQRTL